MSNANQPLYIVTGATGGIGKVIALTLAMQGKAVVLACRNTEKAEALAREAAIATQNNDITALRLDLASFEGVRSFMSDLKALGRPVAALINNAGTLERNSSITVDGYETTIQVNYLSTIYLTLLMEPLFEEKGGNVVFTTSVMRKVCSIPEGFPADEKFSQLLTYARSKNALTLLSIYLSTTLRTRRINVNCADPGIVNTKMLTMDRWFDPLASVVMRPFASKPIDGASSALNALKAGEEGVNGMIFHHDDEPRRLNEFLKDKDTFIRVCNDTLRILKKEMPANNEEQA